MFKHMFLSQPIGKGYQVYRFSKIEGENTIQEMNYFKDPTGSFWLCRDAADAIKVDAAAGNELYKAMLKLGYSKKHPQDIEMLPVMDLNYWRSTHLYQKAEHPEYF